MVSFTLRVVVATEDAAADSHQVVQTLLKRIFCDLLEEQTQTQRIEFVPAVDETPAGRRRAQVLHANLWRKLIVEPVKDILDGRGQIERLAAFVPYYSIEAWLYQNQERLDCLAAQQQAAAVRPPAEGWEEVDQPKEFVIWLRDRFNLTLATAFPVQPAYDTGRSFTSAVETLRSVPGLVEALTSTVVPP